MSGNRGRKAHHHALHALELLVHHHWNFELMERVRAELEQAAELLRQHLNRVKCPCGDRESDVRYYESLLADVERCLQERNLSPIPLVQESLEQHFFSKTAEHRCIWRLIHTRHEWIRDIRTG